MSVHHCRLAQPAASDSAVKAARTAAVNSQAIRKHFVQLTSALLTPFGPWCQPHGFNGAPAPGQQPPALGLMPSAAGQQSQVSGQQAAALAQLSSVSGPVPSALNLQQQPQALPAFSHADFIAHLQGAQLPALVLQRFKSQASMWRGIFVSSLAGNLHARCHALYSTCQPAGIKRKPLYAPLCLHWACKAWGPPSVCCVCNLTLVLATADKASRNDSSLSKHNRRVQMCSSPC